MHKRRYPTAEVGGAIKVSGRYSRGFDQFSEDESFGALYLATGPEICLGEVYRHITSELLLALNDFRVSELSVEVGEALDCCSPKALGLSLEHLVHDAHYEAAQAIGAAALERGLEGLIVPSATCLVDNLILFSENLRPSSRLEIVSSRDPRLYVERC